MSNTKPRQLNMEILRIVAMLMIITLHYLDKGGVLKEFTLKMGLNRELAWIIEALCMGSVNIYVLISGYFLSKSEFKFKKVILLWAQILCYSWIITAVFAIVTKGAFNFANASLSEKTTVAIRRLSTLPSGANTPSPRILRTSERNEASL